MSQKRPQHARLQRGFTLLELVVVIIIIGVLAAVGVPKYFEFANQATAASVKAMAANLGSAASMNYGAYKVGGTYTAVTTCEGVASLVTPDPITTGGFTITGDTAFPACKVSKSGTSVSFTVPGSAP